MVTSAQGTYLLLCLESQVKCADSLAVIAMQYFYATQILLRHYRHKDSPSHGFEGACQQRRLEILMHYVMGESIR